MGYGEDKDIIKAHERYLRRERRLRLRDDNKLMISELAEEETLDLEHVIAISDASTQTDPNTSHICNRLGTKNAELKRKVEKLKFGTISYFDRDDKVKCYTGLPNLKILLLLHEFCTSSTDANRQSTLTSFQEMVLTLLKLRQNSTVIDIGFRFGVSASTV